MKILLLTTHLEIGGIPIYVVNLARGLKALGHTPIVTSHGGWLERRLHREGIFHYRIPCRTSSELNPMLWFQAFPKLFRLIRKERPDILHAHTRVTQVLAWALSHLTHTPYVTTCHGLYRFRVGRRFFRCWGKWVMAISGPSMDRLVMQYKLAPPHQVVLVRNGVEVDQFLEPPPRSEVEWFRQAIGLKGKPILGGIARLSPIKGFDYLLKAIPRLIQEYPDLHLLLVGEGPARVDLIRLSYELKIADRVTIVHPMDDTRIPMAVMDVFISPALREGFGLALVEAMVAGVPVVASDSGGPSEIIEHGRSGLMVPPGDSKAIEEAVLELLRNPQGRSQIIRAARERACREFDMKRVVGEVARVYHEAVA